MAMIEIDNLKKVYRVPVREGTGLKGAAKGLFSKKYKEISAVDGISMTVEEGEVIGYMGPNGAGKSTTIKMMTGVLEPSSGILSVNGNEPHFNRKKHARNIGVVFGQRTQLWWALPLIESFRVLKEIYQLDDRAYEENLSLYNELLNIQELYDKPIRQMSLGQRTLCDILAAFLHNPKVVFLDEPTIGLDISIKSKIRSLIKELNLRKKTTVILTSHDIGDIEELCSRVIVIDKGKIIYDHPTERLKNMFGCYRTMKLTPQDSQIPLSEIKERMTVMYGDARSLTITTDEQQGTVSFTVNQEELSLMQILNAMMEGYTVKDVMIEEVRLENVIKRIYEGA